MKLCEFLEQKVFESKQDLESALKKVREIIRKPSSGVDEEDTEMYEKIIDTLLASVDDRIKFDHYYNQFMSNDVDAMDFLMDEVYSHMRVKDYEEFVAKAFSVKESKETGQLVKKFYGENS